MVKKVILNSRHCCRQCGTIHDRCTGHRNNGLPCRQQPIRYATVCYSHGGQYTKTKQAVKRKEFEFKAKEMMVTYGLPRDISPQQAITEEIQRTAGHVAWLGGIIRGLEKEDLIWGMTKEEFINASEFPGKNLTSEAKVNMWLNLYMEERKHLAKISKDAISAGIAAEQIQVAKAQVSMFAMALQNIFGDLGLSDEQRKLIPTIVPTHLRALNEISKSEDFKDQEERIINGEFEVLRLHKEFE